MAFSSSIHTLSSIRSYANAHRHFVDSLVPLNGRTLFATKKEALAAANALGIKL